MGVELFCKDFSHYNDPTVTYPHSTLTDNYLYKVVMLNASNFTTLLGTSQGSYLCLILSPLKCLKLCSTGLQSLMSNPTSCNNKFDLLLAAMILEAVFFAYKLFWLKTMNLLTTYGALKQGTKI